MRRERPARIAPRDAQVAPRNARVAAQDAKVSPRGASVLGKSAREHSLNIWNQKVRIQSVVDEVENSDRGQQAPVWNGHRFTSTGTGAISAPRSFGYTITQPVAAAAGKVTLTDGWVRHGGYWSGADQTVDHKVTGAEHSISTAGFTILAVKYTYVTGAEIVTFNAASEAAARALAVAWGADYATRLLLCVQLASDVLSVVRKYHVGSDWDIDPIAALP